MLAGPMETLAAHRGLAELEAALDHLRAAPRDRGSVELVVRRPARGERELLAEGLLHPDHGLEGDDWGRRPDHLSPDGNPDPLRQLTLMGHRVAALVAVDPARIPLAGDQVYVDLDISEANLPPGSRLALGDAVVEISPLPHTGCGNFVRRFGVDAQRFVNSPAGRALRLRGANARVVVAGAVRPGDAIVKLDA